MLNDVPHFDPFSFPPFKKAAIGFEKVFDQFSELSQTVPKLPTYPPYNICKVDENHFVIEIAVAGFDRKDIDIEVTEGTLLVKGEIKSSDQAEYVYKGIADRNFMRKFTLADNVEVRGAEMHLGLLRISLERLVPEEKKPQKIKID